MNQIEVLVGSSALTGVTISLIFIMRRWDQLGRDLQRTVYHLDFPPDLTLDQVTAFVRSLTGLRPPRGSLLGRDSLVFEVIGRFDGIEHRMRVPRYQVDRVLAQLRSLVPGVRATLVKDGDLLEFDLARELTLTSITRPIRTDEAATFAAALLGGMSARIGSGEILVFQVVAYPQGSPTDLPMSRQGGLPGGRSWLQALATPASTTTTDQVALRLRQVKLAEPLFGVALRVGAASAAQGRSGHLVGRVVGSLHQLDQPGVKFVARPMPPRWTRARLARAATPITHAPVQVNARELATLVAWPVGGPTVPGLALVGGREFPPARELASHGRIVGRSTYPGMERPIAISREAALMHMLVSGPTGSGKSTYLLNLIKQDIDAGHGLILIDPNGDLARDAIDVITPERSADLIFIDPADSQAVGLNPLASALDDAELVADQVLELVRDRSESWGVQIEETLKNTLVLLAATPGMTLAEVPAVLVDEGFRHRLINALDPVFAPTVGEFFARFGSWSSSQQAQAASAVLNKTSKWLDRRPSRAMLGQAEPAWSMRRVLDEHKILVVALPSGVIGSEAADLIGGLVVAQAWHAAQGRVAISRGHRQPTFLYIDELPRFVRGGIGLGDILARARGHGLGLVGVVQHVSQVRPDLRAALMSEARNKIILQPAADDAAALARHLPGVKAEDLMSLAPRTAIAALVVGGQVVSPVSIATFPPPEPTGHGDAARAASRQTFGRDRAEVERAIAERRRGGEAGPRRTRRLP